MNPAAIRWQARNDYYVFKYTLTAAKRYLGSIAGKRMLDLGCGELFPVTLLFHSLNLCNIIGIDLKPLISSLRSTRAIHDLTIKSFPREIKRFYRHHIYYRELQNIAEFPLKFGGLDLRQMDACQMNFADETFDFVTSNAVFEHVTHVDEVISEMHRVMKKGAVSRNVIHLFASLTGGHTVTYSVPGTDFVALGPTRPWDHLRGGYVPSGLNRLREKDYKQLFKDFDILEWYTQCQEPKHFLSPSIRSELTEYPEEELLKRAIVIVLRK